MEVTPYVPSEYSLPKTEYDPHRLPPIRSGDLVSKSDETPIYTVNNNRYALPPSNILRAISDQQSGEIDSWPANASGGSGAFRNLALTNQGRLVHTGASLRGKLDTTPKPRFLAIIEDYLYRELKALGVEDTVANESRLQVFREVFSTIIDDFKTYKPLLSAIKNEYEIMLTHLNDKVIDLEPLRQQLVLLSEQCDKKLMQYRKEEREEISLLKEEKRRLQQTIRQLTNQNQNLETNIQRLQDEVASQYQLYRKELDARKLLMNDANDLRNQQEKRIEDKEGIDEQGMKKEDPIMMRIALKQARKDLNGALAKITHMEANYNDVVPRRDFVALEAKSGECLQRIKELQIVNDNQSQEIEQLRTQNENIKEDIQRLQREKDELNLKNENIHDEMTPRPSWNLAGEVIDGGAERWMNVSVSKTSQEKLVLLLNEFTGGNDDDGSGNLSQTTTIPEQLSPRGEGEQVPFHLRSSRAVKNRRLTRRDVAVLIQEIWTERRISDKQDGRTKSLSEFIYEFFRNRYGNHNTAVEMGYNLDYSCKRFKYNENCQLFYHILSGEADEDIYHYTKNLIEQLADRIIKESETHPNGTVTADAFQNMLAKYLPHKTPSDISELVAATEKEQPNTDQLSVAKLFSVDDEDNYGEFIRVLKRHLNEDKQSYVHDVSEKIENSSSVSAKDLEQTLRAINPHIQTNELAHVVQWTFEAKDGSQIPSMSVNDILQRLQNGVFFRQHTLAAS
ncbi:unnamed protein product [Rotaria socialis]|uniref:Translin-associated factor X-interacting protein 1 N-terminal domain-containing protein n=1 Tax=Rotaria socialis TaxID=392032 RepID=A0A817YW09_9BILA|nr:unnamed protein product [Rotaria socialis]CAF3340859.1 unnamed protein product [Rotaria socialis]CAF3374621.1 unnamed protein product [Rotaria socialis]CAF3385445.1 unnamed protein product [Rotaria socialis]CAF3501308.1 unnamed protein product [Rotaria socialis]